MLATTKLGARFISVEYERDVMTDLRPVHIAPASNNAGKIVAAVVVLLALSIAGIYSYKSGMWNGPPKQAVSDSQLPSPGLPVVGTSTGK